LANAADLRIRPPREMAGQFAGPAPVVGAGDLAAFHHDPRVPMPGAILSRTFRGRRVEVMVVNNGFEYGDRVYESLISVVRAATGTPWNGFEFFGLNRRGNG